MTTRLLWDRKTEGGFPEVKHLKQLVRNVIDPSRDLGHVDRGGHGKGHDEKRIDERGQEAASTAGGGNEVGEGDEECQDCI